MIRPVCKNCGETRPYKLCPVCKTPVEEKECIFVTITDAVYAAAGDTHLVGVGDEMRILSTINRIIWNK